MQQAVREAVSRVERSAGELGLEDTARMLDLDRRNKARLVALDLCNRANLERAAPLLPWLSKHREGARRLEEAGTLVDLRGRPMAIPPRFPLGAAVECHVGDDEFIAGTVVGLYYRQDDWPDDGRRAPYQVQTAGDGGKTIYVPADEDNCVRSGLRFEVGAAVECRMGDEDRWIKGTVVARYYREEGWEPERWAPYQIRLDAPEGRGESVLIFAPADDDACVRASER